MEAGVDQQLFELRKSIEVRRVERIQLCLRLLDRRAVLQTPHVPPAVVVPRLVGLLLRGEGERDPEAGFGIHEREVARHDANDEERSASGTDRLADDCRIAAEELRPQAVAQNDLLLVTDLAVAIVEDRAARWRNPQQPEEGRRCRHSAYELGSAVDVEREVRDVEHRLLVVDRERAQPIVVIGHAAIGRPGRPRTARVRVAIRHQQDSIGPRHRQRLQQNRIDDREEGGVGAETDR